jgi:hypothetical protein
MSLLSEYPLPTINKMMSTMRKFFHGISLAMLFAALSLSVACSSQSNAEQKSDLDQVQALIDRGDLGSAQSICDEVHRLQSKGTNRDAKILGRLSILYMKLSDVGEHEANVENAYQCFVEAYAADSVAAQEYYNSLNMDEMSQGVLLAGIVHNAKNIPDVVGELDSDSIASDSVVANTLPNP